MCMCMRKVYYILCVGCMVLHIKPCFCLLICALSDGDDDDDGGGGDGS